MSFTKVKNDFIEVATSNEVRFASASNSFLHVMNNGDIDYPIMILEPPTKSWTLNKDDDYQYFDVTLYAITKDTDENGEETNDSEMVDVWDMLSGMVRRFVEKLQEDKPEYIVTSKIIEDPNAHQFFDSTILLKVKFTIRLEIENC